ncbi:EboA domain-containing protein [Streptomyces sp. WMMB303]|uniref:EboA domain-containing protein n=1 Tax=Streptomyces sp. WMMB303 TaxID=3034154 RepID=UPI0023EAF942|nr:EboA domain-containing protein [Streptomyces sp. WMMB303]MDF4252619.1 EboA domain-containing protein [Streptomyces sp. WMMB303]
MLTPLASLRTGLELRLAAEPRAWLHRALAEAADDRHRPAPDVPPDGVRRTASAPSGNRPDPPPTRSVPRLPRWELHFARAGRTCRGAAADGTDVPDPVDAARVLILHAAAPGIQELTRLYRHGTGDERRAVLLALPHLDPPPEQAAALELVEDALRTNDTRLIAAALGPYAAAHLDAHQWRHGVLKCLFTGVPLTVLAGLAHRASGDAELARMLEDYARERTAAGRSVPADLDRVLRLARLAAPGETGKPAPVHPPRPAAAPPTTPPRPSPEP